MAELEITLLGTGTSHGVPMIGCCCAVCRSEDPRDRRHRASAAVRVPDGRVILIDTPPELRLEAIAAGLTRVDAIVFTHAHADHIVGLDDVRRFNAALGGSIPAYGDARTIDRVRAAFSYADVSYESVRGSERPAVSFQAIAGPTDICGVRVIPVPLHHGRLTIFGYRIGDLAYCTDCSEIPEESWALLEGLELLVLDGLRHTPHPTHFNLTQALEAIGRIRPRRTLLTHITHELPHAATNAKLPPGVELAFDGQRQTVGFRNP